MIFHALKLKFGPQVFIYCLKSYLKGKLQYQKYHFHKGKALILKKFDKFRSDPDPIEYENQDPDPKKEGLDPQHLTILWLMTSTEASSPWRGFTLVSVFDRFLSIFGPNTEARIWNSDLKFRPNLALMNILINSYPKPITVKPSLFLMVSILSGQYEKTHLKTLIAASVCVTIHKS